MTASVSRPRFASDALPGNPFATRYTRPGVLAPLDHDGEPLDLELLQARLRRVGAAAIQGPHGHGKTTLLMALAEAFAADGWGVKVVRVRGWRDAWAAVVALATDPPGSGLFIDGGERFGILGPALRILARGRRRVLLFTAHRAVGLPVLWRCATTADLLRAIVARLPDHHGLIADADVAAAFGRHGGDLRESLADLYDLIESRRGPVPAPWQA